MAEHKTTRKKSSPPKKGGESDRSARKEDLQPVPAKGKEKTEGPKSSELKLTLRNLRLADYEDVKEAMDIIYADQGGGWSRDQFAAHLRRFPEGQICVEANGKVVAAVSSLIVNYKKFGDRHTYRQITGNGYFTTHDPKGDTLYGAEVFVHPDYRGLRLARRLYDARKELCENLNLKGIILGGRIPGYSQYKSQMSPQRYIKMVQAQEIFDPVLGFQIANEFHVRKVVTDYSPHDKLSAGYAVLLEWINIYYEEEGHLVGGKKPVVRLGVVQWQMRPVESFEDLCDQCEFFVDAVAGYNADFVLFPELFNAPLMAQFNQESPANAIRALAAYTPRLREELSRMAVSYNINIIAGSIPDYREHELHNISYVCRRDGTWDGQYKLHITPDEGSYWGLVGGKDLKIFDTDIGKIGILICYDVEFPEPSRILADQGMQILFVPYWTDTQNAYLRVRRCAQARAIENECYVVISGSVGNLPRVENMDIQYGHSAVFTPSDFSFSKDAIAAEATPNAEMTLVVDLDLDLLKELRSQGTVRNLSDRRRDLYRIEWLPVKRSSSVPKKGTTG